jgi:superfamily II DNA or RNA helicase
MSLVDQLRPGLRLHDSFTGRERVVHSFERRGPVVKLWFDNAVTGTPDVWPLPIDEVERRFQAVGASETAFRADPELVRLVAEARRLEHAFLFNPAFATETSLIDPLPHQMIAVYGATGFGASSDATGMLANARLRFLLADDAGAGKTIMAGLYIREMLQRRMLRRVLIVPPAGLVPNWKRELRNLFRLPVRDITRADTNEHNPFADPAFDLAIISVDTLSRDAMKALLLDAPPYDLVVFDEAHKLSARRERDLTVVKSRRYELAESIAAQGRHLLLLTATPHMGKDDPYYYLWRLLDPVLLSSMEAFHRAAPDVRARHLLRRMKEEMVRFDGTAIYPDRTSRTVAYPLEAGSTSSAAGFVDLATEDQAARVAETGEVSERALYARVTRYCEEHYNRARQRNRGAAGLAMSVLQRRLASSTLAILRSIERRAEKLATILQRIEQGLQTPADLAREQAKLPSQDLRDTTTGDEEETDEGREAAEQQDEELAAATDAFDPGELRIELAEVKKLRDIARALYDRRRESKFERLWEALQEYPDEKVLVFTEHRDTMEFLVERLESLGLSGRIARIHGGMSGLERDAEVERFRAPDGARYLVATDAAGEGINLQFCWLMVNYDIPWNPARVEQRMGRIHRYGQTKPVVLLNLVSKDTREGRVLDVLLTKLETIRRELSDDKVFDIIGRRFLDRPLPDIIRDAVLEGREREAADEVACRMTIDGVRAELAADRKRVESSDVRRLLDGLNRARESAELRRVMPGYVRAFFVEALRMLGASVEGPEDAVFGLRDLPEPARRAAEVHPEGIRDLFTFARELAKPERFGAPRAVYLHPGEPVYEAVGGLFLGRFEDEAARGGLFVDPKALAPYRFHLCRLTILRDRPLDPFATETSSELVRELLVGVRVAEDGTCTEVPAHHLLALRAAADPARVDLVPVTPALLAAGSDELAPVETFLFERHGTPLLAALRAEAEADLPGKRLRLREAYNLREAELLMQKKRLKDGVARGEPAAQSKLRECTVELESLDRRRAADEAAVVAEAAGLRLGPVQVFARALVLPAPPEDGGDGVREDDRTERVAMDVARRYEEAAYATVEDVHDPARAAGCDFVSHRPDGTIRYIEVKGCKRTGGVELKPNEWAQAANHRERYWLYVVFNCESDRPELNIVQDPVGRGVGRPRGEIVIAADAIRAWGEKVTLVPATDRREAF